MFSHHNIPFRVVVVLYYPYRGKGGVREEECEVGEMGRWEGVWNPPSPPPPLGPLKGTAQGGGSQLKGARGMTPG